MGDSTDSLRLAAAPIPNKNSTAFKALARAHRWKKLLDEGRYGSVIESAAGEKLDRGYLWKILMLTLLAPFRPIASRRTGPYLLTTDPGGGGRPAPAAEPPERERRRRGHRGRREPCRPTLQVEM